MSYAMEPSRADRALSMSQPTSRQQALLEAFRLVRALTVILTKDLSAEDCILQ